MDVLRATVLYVSAFVALGAIAFARARRDETPLKTHWLAVFGTCGLAASVIASGRSFSAPAMLATATVAICAVSDLASGLIYNAVLAIAALGFGALALVCGHGAQMLGGAATSVAISWALHSLTRGRGLGFGDVKLFTIVGAAYGASGALCVVASAFVIGAANALVMLALGRARIGVTMPFAPFIALSTMGAACIGLGV